MKELEYKGPKCDQAVDIAIFNDDCTKILLGRKKDQSEFRFIGGFSDVLSDSLEEDAIREVYEETNLIVSNPLYICSRKVEDPRYVGTIHSVKTCLFMTVGVIGEVIAGDDIEEVRWFDSEEFKTMELRPEHMKLRDLFFLKVTK
jgi:bifunctional NMN adenylyltransferase/nudix hydrolase